MRNPSILASPLDMGIARATIKDNEVAERIGFKLSVSP